MPKFTHRKNTLSFDERIVPDETDKGAVSVHLKRYVFAREFCGGKVVLDAACGSGYGSSYLAETAAHVTGIDLSPEAVDYAWKRYSGPNICFETMDAVHLRFGDNTFDTIVSFETVEHVSDVGAYLNEVRRVLKPDGVYLVSTPCAPRSTQTPENPFHVQEWSAPDFSKLLSGYFDSVRMFGQKRKQTVVHRFLQRLDFLNLRKKLRFPKTITRLSYAVGTVPFADLDLNDLVINENELSGALFLVGVCAKPRKT